MLPSQTVPLDGRLRGEVGARGSSTLEEHDDVQNVYANFDIPDDVLSAVVA